MAAADEDDVLKKLRRAAAGGVGASGSLSAERVQTVMRHTREVMLSYERSHGTDDFLNDTFQACDMKCFEFEVNRFSSGVLGVDTTSCAIDDDGKPLEELKELVARKHWLRLQDWEHNDAVFAARALGRKPAVEGGARAVKRGEPAAEGGAGPPGRLGERAIMTLGLGGMCRGGLGDVA
jgi:hypothetical protein